MPIRQAICDNYKMEILAGLHSGWHTYKIALYTSAASLGPGTTGYTTAHEVPEGGGYKAAGKDLLGMRTESTNGVAIMEWTDPVWSTATFSARGALIYNDSLEGKKAVCVLDFGADYACSNGSFTVQFPAFDKSNALIRISS